MFLVYYAYFVEEVTFYLVSCCCFNVGPIHALNMLVLTKTLYYDVIIKEN